MYTLPQLIALGFGAALGAKAFGFAVDSTANFIVGVIIGRLMADRFAFQPLRKQALALVSHTDCLLCHETHHVHQGLRPISVRRHSIPAVRSPASSARSP